MEMNARPMQAAQSAPPATERLPSVRKAGSAVDRLALQPGEFQDLLRAWDGPAPRIRARTGPRGRRPRRATAQRPRAGRRIVQGVVPSQDQVDHVGAVRRSRRPRIVVRGGGFRGLPAASAALSTQRGLIVWTLARRRASSLALTHGYIRCVQRLPAAADGYSMGRLRARIASALV